MLNNNHSLTHSNVTYYCHDIAKKITHLVLKQQSLTDSLYKCGLKNELCTYCTDTKESHVLIIEEFNHA